MPHSACGGCPFLGMTFDRDLRAAYPHPSHVCWAVAERTTLATRLRRWLHWHPRRAVPGEPRPWQARAFSPVLSPDQAQCLGTGYRSCPHYPHPTSMLRRLALGAR